MVQVLAYLDHGSKVTDEESAAALKSLPLAPTVGNHDSTLVNYTYHFNTPNNSELGSNGIVGGDYWFTYGNAL